MILTIPSLQKLYARHKMTSLMKFNSMGAKLCKAQNTTSLMKVDGWQNYARRKTTNPYEVRWGEYVVVVHLVTLELEPKTNLKPQLGVELQTFFLLQVLFSECSCMQSTKF
jgi:hypothetical protein